ncbi:MAG: hypothetical protein KAX19_13880 [Candidatus Brocadiae bacterium]|nr:hypothetical protein [Candidatus Brocadiia bacterium]
MEDKWPTDFPGANWLGDEEDRAVVRVDVIPGCCKDATSEEIREHSHVVTSGRCVGVPEIEEAGERFGHNKQ